MDKWLALEKHWRLFETNGGFLGLCPKNSKQGDLVCVLLESDLPVVLRKSGGQYVFVGVCFVFCLARFAKFVTDVGLKRVEMLDIV